jgi:hypothetical protein
MNRRQELVQCITEERERQFNLPGSEFDLKNTPSDWLGIVGHYLFDATFRNGQKPDKETFRENLVKAGAVILAALENVQTMDDRGHFNKDE